MNVKFYTSVAKGLKLNVREFWGQISTFVEVTGEKLVGAGGGGFLPWVGLNFVYIVVFVVETALENSKLAILEQPRPNHGGVAEAD